MLHLKEAIGHFSLVKPYYIYRPCPVRQVAIGKAGDADGGAEVFQRLFEELAVLVLGWDIGRKVAHVANLYEQALLKTMCKALVVFPFFALNVKLTHYLVATFSKAQSPGCILNISSDCCTILRIDSLGVFVAHDFVSTR